MLLKKKSIFIFFMLIAVGKLYAQTACTTLGQNPSTAFPVCGTNVFQQDSVPICSSNNLYVPGCSIPGDTSTTYQNKNPFWYKFTCFQSGTLSFVIIPDSPNEDYDWQLYDITGHNPDDVYTDTTLVVSGNWAGTYDSTGASAAGVNYIQCASDPTVLAPTFALSPNIIQSHNYLLMVSHFSDSEQGYSLSFSGGTAVITDTLPPHIINANRASCDATQILVKLNKRMKCSSLAANGSDFIISPAAANIINAVGIGCAGSFDMDSVLLTFNQPVPIGNYNLVAQNGTDGNTLLDICDNDIPVGESIPFIVRSPLPVPMDSLINNWCSSDSLILVFPALIKCSSVAPDGSDFFITGTYPVNISSANPFNCVNGLTNRITIHFTTTLQQPGNFQIVLQVGSDGNTLLSECDTASVAGSAVAFKIVPKPNPGFAFPNSVCLPDGNVLFTNLSFIADATENLFQFIWNFGDSLSGANNFSTVRSPIHRYNLTGPFNVNLQVTSSGGCTRDTTILLNTIHPQPKTEFGMNKPAICLGDAVVFTDSTNSMDGVTLQWNWNLGDGTIRNTQNVTYTYSSEQTYDLSLFTVNNFGCYSDTLHKFITVYPYPTVNAGPDRFVLEGGSLTIQATATGNGLQYLWTPALYLNDPYIIKPKSVDPKNDITYLVTVTSNGGCKVTDEMFVKVLKIPRIPNTFTPNNDGINDLWTIQYLEDYPSNHIQVFTRAGQMVYENRGYYKPWNGTYHGKPLPVDTYYYILEPGSGREPLTGYVTIIK